MQQALITKYLSSYAIFEDADGNVVHVDHEDHVTDQSAFPYRIGLGRSWARGPLLMFLMLNPSTANAFINDPTIERCERRGRAGPWAGIMVGNLFAFRATDPKDMKYAADRGTDPVGQRNMQQLLIMAAASDTIVCAWGTMGHYMNRATVVYDALCEAGHRGKIHVLGLTQNGSPRHPLYVPYSAAPQPYRWT